MKTLTSLFTLLLVSVASFAGTGNDPKNENAKNIESIAVVKYADNVKLFYTKKNSEKVKLTIYDSEGKTIGTSYVNNEKGFIQPFNFNGLPYGDYSIKIEDQDGINLQKFTHAATASSIKSSVYDINNTNRYKLFVLNQKDSPISIKVYNEDSEIVHEQKVEDKEAFSQVIDLSKAGGEKFTFQVSNGVDTSFEVQK